MEETGMKNRAVKIIILNLCIALLNVLMFSKGLLGLTFAGEAFKVALAVTVVVMSLVAFFYGNYVLLFSEKKEPPVILLKGTELTKPEDYVQSLIEKRGRGVFDEDINTAIEQIGRMEDKDRALDSILEQFFTPQEITFTRFQNAINSVQAIFYNNVKKMINRMIIFDYKDYSKLLEKVKKSGYSTVSRSVDTQMSIYSEHITYVRGLVSMNEDILIKLDGLLLEISKLDDLDEEGLENMAAVQEINDLIEQTKFYKG